MKEYIAMWKNFANFKDRTTVKGYWMAFLINLAVSFVLGLIAGLIPVLTFVGGIYTLALIIPSLAIMIRRLRDAGKNWAWIFIALIPLAGQIVLLVFLCQPSVAENPTGAEVV